MLIEEKKLTWEELSKTKGVGDEEEEREKMFRKSQGLKTGTTKYLFMKIGCFNYKKQVKNTKNPEIYIN
ncbi:hypothetical protein [Dolichospermum sp. FACHB-1091]|uniref:hypothetical protein n=1 Tax=Dolichospermum sp. FACHB-1091 TaxID=2692798 RepID=UPI0016803BE0|nr:hypothetical protein [Dolichospermum sp. FACHB-1091]